LSTPCPHGERLALSTLPLTLFFPFDIREKELHHWFEVNMKIRGFLALLVLTVVVVYFIFFAKAGKKSYIEGTTDAYEKIQVQVTRANMATLEKAIEYFVANEGRTPADLKELSASRLLAGDASDGWSRPLKYVRVSDSNFRLISAGRDGKFDTSDDIVVEY
jgi:hypothetical protein